MTRKNTIFIVIDSLYYERTIKTNTHEATMPFLDKLRSEGINYSNMYSEAPYTEAALVSLLCGIDTMKKGGYLLKLKDKETIMETFKKNGYDTFCNCVQPIVYPSYSYQGLTDEYYNICYNFESLWAYRLEFYSKKYNNHELEQKHLEIIRQILSDNMVFWRKFFKDLANKDEKVSFILPYLDLTNLDQNTNLLEEEYKKFKKDELGYVEALLSLGKAHSLFKIKSYELTEKMTYDDMKKLYYRYKKIIRKMSFKNIKYNVRNNKLVLIPKNERKDLVKAYFNAVYNRFLKQKIDYHDNVKKAAPSMDTTFKHFESWLLKRKSNKPYFAYIHVDDCHRGEMFYTYDTNDFNQLDQEFKMVDEYLNKLPRGYRGNISYDVSLQYADNCLKKLYNFLDDNKMLDEVTIAICADHGSSYTFDPYRSNYVNNVHKENYNMPFVVWNKEIKHEDNEYYYNTKDIPATLLYLNGIDVPLGYDGRPAIYKNSREYVILENVNGGCPDYNLRDILLGVRNKKFLVVMSFDINRPFSDGKLHSVYDLLTDKKELYNLKDTIDKQIISKELGIIEKEFEILKEDIKKNNYLNK